MRASKALEQLYHCVSVLLYSKIGLNLEKLLKNINYVGVKYG